MHPFKEYLKQHNLEALAVSIKAQVRYVTVWNAVKGNPITENHAQKIRQAVIYLTGIPYSGHLPLSRNDVLTSYRASPLKKFLDRPLMVSIATCEGEKS